MLPATLAQGPSPFESLESIPPEVRQWIQLAFAVIVGAVLAADLLILVLHWNGLRCGRPLIAPRWSVVDVFLALQLVLWLTIVLGVIVLIPVSLVMMRPGAASDTDSRLMSAVLLLILVIQNIVTVGVVSFFVRRKYGEALSAVGLTLRRWRPGLLLGFGVALVSLPISDFLERLAHYALTASPSSPATEVVEALTRLVDVRTVLEPLLTPAWLGVLILVVGVIGPFGEEVFFRGFAYTAMKRRFGVSWGMMLSATLFSLIHTNPMAAAPIFVVGMVLAYLYERTGTLAAPFAFHAANNTAAVLALYFAPEFTFWGWLFPSHG